MIWPLPLFHLLLDDRSSRHGSVILQRITILMSSLTFPAVQVFHANGGLKDDRMPNCGDTMLLSEGGSIFIANVCRLKSAQYGLPGDSAP